ncbi:hypothetical protein HMPREF1544_00171 [Mucor circinelloides 1006PhL]|uniref:Uncharacterized protein n=1 Tax=Mucor circinelloides f. circinelloides (strain 1006PhL) TaxID=1220926 RepID=S2JX88_MUCC1|nr:hypothetical protein HMPREF1544_00171 [Mucor circinelloides 1006PhL]
MDIHRLSRMYALNEKIQRQSIPDQSPSIDANLVQTVTNPTTVIEEIDLDIVAAASRVATSSISLLQAVDRLQTISNEKMASRPTETDRPFSLTTTSMKATCVTFIGNWSGSDTYVKGHFRKSTNLYYKQLDVSIKHSVVPTNELE